MIRRVLFRGERNALEERVVQEIQAARRADPVRPVDLLIGSNLLGLYLMRLIARRLGATAFIQPLTFLDLAYTRAGASLRAAGRAPVPPLGGELLMAEIVRLLPAGYFDPVRPYRGLRGVLLDSIRDLKDAGWSPEDLSRAIERASVGRAGRRKIAQLLEVWTRFEGRLRESGFYDRSDLLAAAGGQAAASGPGDSAMLLVYGFYDLTELQWRLLLTESARRETAVVVPWEEGGDFDFALRFLDRLAHEGFLEEPARASEGTGHEHAPQGPVTSVLSAPGELREATEVVRRVLEWAQEGIPFEEMAVLVRTRDGGTEGLTRALERAGIPHVQHGGRSAGHRRAARAAAAFMKIAGEDWPREAVMEFLSVADLDPRLTLGTAAVAAGWDRLSAEAGIVGGRAAWNRTVGGLVSRLARVVRELEAKADFGGDGSQNEDDDEGGGIGEELDNARRRLDEARGLASVLAAIDAAIALWPGSESWSGCVDGFLAALRSLVRESEDRSLVEGALAPLASLDPIGPCADRGAFRELAQRTLEDARAPGGRFQKDGLLVADLLSARGLALRAVVLAGAAEGSFPVRGSQDPVLLDDERAALTRAAPSLAPLPAKGSRLAEERLLFRLATGAAREKLLVSWSRLSSDGRREIPPSPFLKLERQGAQTHDSAGGAGAYPGAGGASSDPRAEGADADPGEASGAVALIVPFLPLAHPDPARAVDAAERRLSIAAALAGADEAEALSDLAGEVPYLARVIGTEHSRWGSRKFGAHDGWLEGEAAKRSREWLVRGCVPATRIEEYATCPLKAFFHRVLGLRPLRDPERVETLDPRDRGSLVHEILAGFVERLAEGAGASPRFAGRDAGELRGLLREAARAGFESAERRGVTGYPLLWEVERSRILTDLDRWLAFEIERAERTASAPLAVEWRFGIGQAGAGTPSPDSTGTHGPPATVILENGETVVFSGRIDRIDRVSDGPAARVIDYKTGRPRGNLGAGIKSGRGIQLPVYMLAARGFVDGSGRPLDPVEGELLYLRNDIGAKTLGRDALALLDAPFRSALATLLAAAAAGDFTADPRDPAVCRACDFRTPCGEGRGALFARKRGDPRIRERLRLLDQAQAGDPDAAEASP